MQFINTDGIRILIYTFEKRSAVEELSPMAIPYFDLTLCVEGEMHYIYEGKQVKLCAGDGILFPQGSIRERLASPVPSLYASFNIQLDKGENPSLSGYLPKCITPQAVALLEELKKDFSSFSPYKKEKFLSLFSYIYHSVAERVCDAENGHVRQIKNYICMNLSEKLTLDGIARHVHLAPQYVCTLFKKQTGLTVTEFITGQRIDLAKRLLIASDEPIFMISEKCGFDDYSYFSHAFKAVCKISPMAYRKSRRAMI